MIASLSLVKSTASQLQGQDFPFFSLVVNGHPLRGAIVKDRGEVMHDSEEDTNMPKAQSVNNPQINNYSSV